MPTTPKAGLPVPALTDSPNAPAQINALGQALDNKVIIPVPNEATRDALGTTGNLTVQRLDNGDYESNFGGSWSRITGPVIQGKMWRTNGTSTPMAPNVPTTVVMNASRTQGGVTFNDATDAMTLPQNGFYELRAFGNATAGSGYTVSYRIVRRRSSVSDLEIAISSLLRKVDASDEMDTFGDTLPLQAGDQIYLRTYFSGAGSYYGASEFTGVFVSARYVAPLSGASPV